jgi:hypothetical protein
VQKDQFLEIKEFAENYAKLDRPPYRLGGMQLDASTVPQKSERSPANQ